jgi:hypothetical protein
MAIAEMGLTSGGPGPPGALFHWVTLTEDGTLQVTDVWESREQFEAFAEEQIGPYTAEVGLPEPAMTHHEVHNYFRPA